MKHHAFKLAALACLFSLHSAQAAVMLSGGLSHEYTLNPGSTVSGVLELKNTGNEPAEVKIYQEDVKINADGSTEYTPGTGSHNRSNANWISLGTDRVILDPGAAQSVPYTLQVPTDNLQGSYWSMLMLEPVSNKSRESQLAQTPSDQPSLTIHQKVRYAVQVLANVGNKGASNLTFAAPSVARDAQGIRWFSVDLSNTGTRHSRPNVSLDVFAADGNSIGRFKAETHGLYNGEREVFSINLDSLQPGNYKALLAAEDNNNGQVFGSDINLTIKP
ncbi:MAG: hypothetical protein BWK73_05060 [Thiothrix lacustris]|uniref:DUF3324 domain-containing protein n=1 Tax=Thiothrix lacustris TaxID=525917 RepID=A0A1Y1QY32_9GAMM|nr:MAG: hypothetical protein BWK73_05060 [Thiothrix lacustris]